MDTGVWFTDEVRAVCRVLQVPQQQPDHCGECQCVQWPFSSSNLVSEPERMHECVWMPNDLRRDMHAEGWTAEQNRRGVGAGDGACHDAHAHALARQLRAWTCWHRARMGKLMSGWRRCRAPV